MSDEMIFDVVDPLLWPEERAQIENLLGRCGLDYEQGVEVFVVCRHENAIAACVGLEKNIVKCAAIAPELRGGALGLTLLTEVINLAHERGHNHLFAYTKAANIEFFRACGFYPLVDVPDFVALLENTPIGIKTYCDGLRQQRRPGEAIGAIVMNANPFTNGHRYLVERAAAACDWLHVFVVAEDVSLIKYRDRHALVSAGVADIPRAVVHHGSDYMVSRATFPTYFFKEKGIVGDCCTAVDLLMFRNYIAPALGITHRFVGTEPFCPTTCKYNSDMRHWLCGSVSPAPPIEVVEIERATCDGVPISASQVRRLLTVDDFTKIRRLVPPTTEKLLKTNYRVLNSSST